MSLLGGASILVAVSPGDTWRCLGTLVVARARAWGGWRWGAHHRAQDGPPANHTWPRCQWAAVRGRLQTLLIWVWALQARASLYRTNPFLLTAPCMLRASVMAQCALSAHATEAPM